MFKLLSKLALVFLHVPLKCLQDGDKVLQNGLGTGFVLILKALEVRFISSVIFVIILEVILKHYLVFFEAFAHSISSAGLIGVFLCG